MKKLILLLVLGCSASPVSESRTDNPDVKVDLLFTHDGCKVYRFMDGGMYPHYFAKCGVEVTTLSTESCGKNCTYEAAVPTVRR